MSPPKCTQRTTFDLIFLHYCNENLNVYYILLSSVLNCQQNSHKAKRKVLKTGLIYNIYFDFGGELLILGFVRFTLSGISFT